MDRSEKSPDELLKLADDTFQNREIEQALVHYQAALTAAKEEFNRPVEVESLAQIARMFLLLGKREEGEEYLKEAAVRVETGETMGWSRYLGVKGRFEWKASQLSAARFTFAEMFEFCSSNELWSRAIDAANMMAIVSEDSASQVQWSKRGIELAENSGVESWLGPLWNNLATTYFDQKNYVDALDAFLKARDFHWHYSNETAKLFADYHVGMTYRFLGEYAQAQSWLRPVLAWAERIENYSVIGQALEDLAECDLADGHKARALEQLQIARKAFEKDGLPQRSPDLWNSLIARIDWLASQI